MAKLEILTFPDPILKSRAKEVDKITPDLLALAQDMLETMYKAPGVGLAANQIGVSKRMLVIDVRHRNEDGTFSSDRLTPKESQYQYPLIIFNPKIISQKTKCDFEEGCLSVPGYMEVVKRFAEAEVEALNEKGKKVLFQTDGILAICLQHEIDHLEGRLFIDRLSTVKRGLLKAKIKKYGYSTQDKTHVL